MTSDPGERPERDPRWNVTDAGEDRRAHGPAGGGAAGEPGDEAAGLDPLLTAAVRELRRPLALDAALDDRIMAAVAVESLMPAMPDAAGPGRAGRAWRWLRRPRTVRISPLGGLASLAGLAAAAALLLTTLASREPAAAPPAPVVAADVPAASAADTIQIIQFVLVAPSARTVALVGDFNDWQVGATPLRPAANGRMWTVEVPLSPGRHRYAFVVDEETWMADPTAPRAPGADFGSPSSVVTIAERSS